MMSETFEEYKKTLEKAMLRSAFLCSGDVVKLDKEIVYSEEKSNEMMSPDFIIKSFSEAYKETIRNFFSVDHKISVSNIKQNPNSSNWFPTESLNKFKARFMIAPVSSYSKLSTIWDTEKGGPFPDYFYPVNRLSMFSWFNSPVNLYYSPQSGYYNVPEETEDTYNFWVTDKPIQSMLWIIQNMDYQIDKSDYGWTHTMHLPIYQCQYESLNIRLRDIQKFRENIIGQIID